MNKLKDPELMKYIIEEVHKQGVVNEEDNIKLLTLKLTLRLVKNADPTSSNLLATEETGAGKDNLVGKTIKVLVPKENYVVKTGLSDKVMNYWNRNKKYKNWTFDGKVLYISDPPKDTLQGDAFRSITSGLNKYSTVIDGKHVEVEIKGKPVIVVTSMKNNIDVEGIRRWDAIHLDSSTKTTDDVLEDILLMDEKQRPKPDKTFLLMLQKIEPYSVIIPFKADMGKELLKLNKGRVKPAILRTKVKTFLDLIKASAVLHQENRGIDNDGNLEAELQDYELAKFAYEKFYGEVGQALDTYEEAVKDALIGENEGLTIPEIHSRVNHRGVTQSWLYDHRNNMMEKRFIEEGVPKKIESGMKNDGSPFTKNVTTYRLCIRHKLVLPSVKQVKKQMGG